ncbi:protein kinase domain containing protein [Nitzschia inconspicua]|uniref:Protein kinase domain containing protein n=1 Tax=Nitzschia inconspicua TaxID=303405 RepID=A0A9K3M290_9STRA|nr:protein kinase domain containing protein [Nitzschia inconspicua]
MRSSNSAACNEHGRMHDLNQNGNNNIIDVDENSEGDIHGNSIHPSKPMVVAAASSNGSSCAVWKMTKKMHRNTDKNKNNKKTKTKTVTNQTKQKRSLVLHRSLPRPLPPMPPRKPRGCKCCRTPLEERRGNRHPNKKKQSQQQHPLWESDGQPGLGWWSDMEHAAHVAAKQWEEATRKQAEQDQIQRRLVEKDKNKKAHHRTNQNNVEKEETAAPAENNIPNTKTTTTASTSVDDKKDTAAATAAAATTHQAEEKDFPMMFDDPDLFLFGGIGGMVLPRPTPITEIQDKHLAKQIASFAKARAKEAAKSRTMEQQRSCHPEQAVVNPSNQDPTSQMALFDYEELQLGKLLGVGGFSHVYEIQGFNLTDDDQGCNGDEGADNTPNESTSTSPSVRRRSSASTAACGRLSFTSFAQNRTNKMMSRRRSSSTCLTISNNNTLYTPQQQLARKFLAQHALRADDITTERNDDDDHVGGAVAVGSLDWGVMAPSKRRASSILSAHHHQHHPTYWNPAEHTQEENSAYFRETRESVSTHLMENSTSFFSQDFQEELHRAAGDTGRAIPRYAVKHLKPSLLQETPMPNKFAKAAMDLACEAEMMMGLNHPNIVKLRGWATGGPGKFKEGKHTSYFLILDRLTGTLHDRIAEWRRQHQKQYSWKRRLNTAWKRSKVAVENCFRPHPKRYHRKGGGSGGCGSSSKSGGSHNSVAGSGNPRAHRSASFSAASSKSTLSPENLLLVERVKVAYDIACALEYLHEMRIVYRDLKSTNIGFNIRGDVQLFDFGLSRYLPSKGRTSSTTVASVTATPREDEKETESQEIRRECGEQPTPIQSQALPVQKSHLSTEMLAEFWDDDESFLMSHVGTRRYTAPEVDCKLPYSLKADVYSFGVVLWEIMSMASAVSKGRKIELAQDHASQVSAKSNATRNSYSSRKRNRRSRIMVPCCCWPKPLQLLVTVMMAENPKDRPTMKDVRSTLEQLYISLTMENPNDPDSQEMYLLKRQRRRSTFRLETWTREVMEDFLEEDLMEEDGQDGDEYDDGDMAKEVESSTKKSLDSSNTSHIS